MSKVIIFIVLVPVLLLSACSITGPKVDESNKGTEQDNNQQVEQKIDLGLLEKTYQMEVKVVLNNYLRQTQDVSLITADDISKTKDSLLAIKVPTKYKDLHLNLVLAMDRMEDYLFNDDEKKLQESQELINQAKEEHDWLN